MKKHLIFTGITTMLILCTTAAINAQNFCKADPSATRVLVDTSNLTAMVVTFQPGKATSLHTHPAHYVYALDAGKLQVNFADGETQTMEFKAGDSFYGEPERPHRTTNVGTKPVRLLLVELNEHPYMAMKK